MKSADAIAFIRAQQASLRAGEARASLPAGSSRAKVATANARWSNAAEHRDRLAANLPADFVAAVQRSLTT